MGKGTERTETPVSVITGATSGLGKALVDACAREHHRIVGIGRNHEELDKLTQRALSLGATSALPVRADLSTLEGRADAVHASSTLQGSTRYLFNVAGTYESDEKLRNEPSSRVLLFDVKVSAPFDLLRAPYPELFLRRKAFDVPPWTAVVYSGSQSQLIDLPGSSIYAQANNMATMQHLCARLAGIDAKIVYFGNLEGTTADSFNLGAEEVIPIATAANEMLAAAQDPSLVAAIILPQPPASNQNARIQKRTLRDTEYALKDDPALMNYKQRVEELFSSMNLPKFG